MTYNSNVGNYYYKDPGVNAGPHALIGTVTQTGYNYDKNGSMTEGNGKTIEWSSFNKPTKFTKGTDSVEFSYGPEYDRYKKKEIKDTGTVETIYIDKVYEKITEGNKTTHKYFMYAEGHLATIHVKTYDNTTQLPDETRYLHYDPLGSVDSITDNRGNIVERMSYEAFGKRRDGNWQSLSNVVPTFTNRGFTGHEHIDSMGIIHMNGRVYDPELGRFLSADPFVSDPYNTQSFNRYSYCMNNPFKYTDPSGYFWQDNNDGGFDEMCGPSEFGNMERDSFLNDISNDKDKNDKNEKYISEREYDLAIVDKKMWAKDYIMVLVEFVVPGRFCIKSLINIKTPIKELLKKMSFKKIFFSIWDEDPIKRGNKIEKILAKTEYKDWFNVGQLYNGKFPLVDFQKGINLVSLKTVNTTGKTWLKRMRSHIADLGSGRATIDKQRANMILDIRVQPGGFSSAESLIEFGIRNKVNVIIKEYY
jgi:RHS repeat-associated protein